ncbi:ARM repeat-containing protein [Ramicandelaber brevisporus]|nr:ARM repeat-containing protein [Ramicandelaber brevisporus]
MSSINIGDLQQIFVATFDPSPEVRNQAEAQLKQAEQQSRLLVTVLELVAHAQANHGARQAGAIYLKNRISKHWDPSSTAREVIPIADEDRTLIKAHILEAIAVVPAAIRVQLLDAIHSILVSDYATKWPEFLPSLVQSISSSEAETMYAGLQVLHTLVKTFRWQKSTVAVKASVDAIVRATFGPLLDIATRAIAAGNDTGYQIAHIIFKIYTSIMQGNLPASLQNRGSFRAWAEVLFKAVGLPVSGDADAENDRERERCPALAAKKWAIKALQRSFRRHGIPSKLSKKTSPALKKFATEFLKDFAPPILHMFLGQIDRSIRGECWLGPRSTSYIMSYLEDCISEPGTWKILKTHLGPVIESLIFPLMWFTDADAESWEDDPAEFVNSQMDPMEDFFSTRSAGNSLLYELVSGRRKTVFPEVVAFIGRALTAHAGNARVKYGALHMLCTIASQIMGKESEARDQIEGALVAHVLPEITSEHGFLRCKALQTIAAFWQLSYSQPANLAVAVNGTIGRLEDPDLPVRVQATMTLQFMLRDEGTAELLRPHLAGVMRALLNIMQQIDLDVVPSMIESIIETFSEELQPFAVELAQQLTANYVRLIESISKAYGSDDEDADPSSFEDFDGDTMINKSSAAMGILKTIDTLVIDLERFPAVLEAMEAAVAPALLMTFKRSTADVFEECLELVETLLYTRKQVSPIMWQIFATIVDAPVIYATELASYVAPSLCHFVTFGVAEFSTPYGPQLIEKLINVVKLIASEEMSGIAGFIAATNLVETMLQALAPGSLDSHLPAILDFASHFVSKADGYPSDSLRVHSIEMALNCIIYNPATTLALLESKNMLSVFELLSSKLDTFVRVHDKRIVVLALSAVFTVPAEQLPQAFHADGVLSALMTTILSTLEALPTAEAHRKEVIAKAENGDVDDDEDFDASGLPDEYEEVDDNETSVNKAESEYVEMLEKAAAAAPGGDDEWDSDDEFGDLDDEDEDLFEDPYFVSEIDNIDPFIRFRDVFGSLETRAPAVYRLATYGMTLTTQQLITSVVSEADRRQLAAASNPSNSA